MTSSSKHSFKKHTPVNVSFSESIFNVLKVLRIFYLALIHILRLIRSTLSTMSPSTFFVLCPARCIKHTPISVAIALIYT